MHVLNIVTHVLNIVTHVLNIVTHVLKIVTDVLNIITNVLNIVTHTKYSNTCTKYSNTYLQYAMDSRYPGGLTSSAFFAGDLSLFAMLMILILDIFIWMVLAVWFDGILPSMLPNLF